MSDTTKKSSKTLLLGTLFIFLLGIIGAQSWVMADMKKQTGSTSPSQTPNNQLNPIDPGDQSYSFFDNDFFNNSHSYGAQNRNPYEEIERMQKEMDRMMKNAFNQFNQQTNFQPLYHDNFATQKMDVKEDNKQYIVTVNLPDGDEKNVTVNINGTILTIKEKQLFEKKDSDNMGNTVFEEHRSGTFMRSINLPGPVKQAGMKTNIKNGVLTITIPKNV